MNDKDDRKSRKELLLEIDTSHTEELRRLGPNTVRRMADGKKVRKISPLGMRVVVRIRKDGNQTDGGLYLPEGAKQAMSESLLAEVVEVASAVDDHTDEETNVSGVPLGALVLLAKDVGTKVPWDDELRIVDTKNILAIVNEIQFT